MKKILVSCILIVFILSSFIACDLKNQELKEPNTETPSQADENGKVNIDLPKLQSEPYCDFEDFSAWWDEDKNLDYLYVYIKAWDVYRKLELPHLPYLDLTSLALGENTATLSTYYWHRYTTEITSYHIDMSKEDVVSYTVEIQTPTTSEANEYFINMHSEDEGYFFFIPENEDPYEPGPYFPLIRFETKDGGKTWNRMENLIFREHLYWRDFLDIAKFVSHSVGIIGYRYVGMEDLCGRTYLTSDGGLTWNRIPDLPYPDSFYNDGKYGKYTEVRNFEIIDNSYILTVEENGDGFDSQYITFKSDDLVNWIVIE